MSDPAAHVVSVEIQGLRYPIKSTLDAEYVAQLATYVDAKIQAASDETPAGDSVRIAVLAALNIADEYFRTRDGDDATGDEILRRVEDLEQLVDRAIALARAVES